ncbi:MAG: DUF1003 domain-containing protein [Bacilli bacterium]|nr:DUF1003 domain-containing protein [Bacilli bacterium]
MKEKKKVVEQPKKTKKEIVKMLLNQNLDMQDEEDLIEMLIDSPLSVDIDKQEEQNIKKRDLAADKISSIVGSWTFILTFCAFLAFWVILNTVILDKPVDPYPFILLNLLLSTVAAIQAPIIMMSQNRQAKKDSLRNHNDYRVDLKSELILESIHNDIEEIHRIQKRLVSYINNQELKEKDLDERL